MYQQEEISLLAHLLKDFVLPFLVGLTSYVLVAKIDEWKTRKKHSRLGIAIIESLIEEVNIGIVIMQNHEGNANDILTAFLPNKSWSGMTTINDDVLLRIIEVNKNLKHDHFPPNEIRVHCKNYFDHMAAEWNNNIASLEKNVPRPIVVAQARGLITERRFLEAAQEVIAMLQTTRRLLEDNSTKIIPA